MPWIRDEAIRSMYGDQVALAQVREKIRQRLEMDVKAVVDLKHAFVITTIMELDPDPEFVWVTREPVATVQSFLSGGSWTARNQYGRDLWRPWNGWQNMESRIEKAVAHWLAVNHICMNQFHAFPNTRMMLCDELEVRLNVYDDRKALNKEQILFVEHRCGDLWREILGLRR